MKRIWLATLLVAQVSLCAQMTLGAKAPFRVSWEGGNLLWADRTSTTLTWETRQGTREIRLPSGLTGLGQNLDFSFKDGRMTHFIPVPETNGYPTQGRLMGSWDGRRWEQLAEWKAPGPADRGARFGVIYRMFQLDQDKLLLFGLFGQHGERELARVALGRITTRRTIQIDALTDLASQFGEGWLVPHATPQGTLPKIPDSRMTLRKLFHEALFETESHILVVGRHEGCVLVFDRSNGKCLGLARLWDEVPLGASDGQHVDVFLGATPMPDGSLLLASRTRHAVQESHRQFPFSYHVSIWADEDKNRQNQASIQASLKAFPEIEWWSFDPVRRRFTPVAAPVGVPNRFQRSSELFTFRFRPKLDGNLVVEGFEDRRKR